MVSLSRHTTPAAAVARLARSILARVQSNPESVLVLPAGQTPLPLYAELVNRCGSDGSAFGRTHLFQLDEVIGLAADDEGSFNQLLRRSFLDPLGLKGQRIHLLDGATEAPGAAIKKHGRELEALGGADLTLLGLGLNGHVAFNEPGSLAEQGARVVQLEGRSEQGMTLGLREILASEEIQMLVFGEGKAEILQRVLATDHDPRLPASMLAGHPNYSIIVDAFAGGPDQNS